MTLVEFLQARLGEYEQAAHRSRNAPADALRYVDADEWSEGLLGLADETFVLRDVEAKRRIIGWADSPALPDYETNYVLTSLALPYADHPDYQQEWAVTPA